MQQSFVLFLKKSNLIKSFRLYGLITITIFGCNELKWSKLVCFTDVICYTC